MKTSNKLLIALGILLIVAPLMSMIIISKIYYKPVNKKDPFTEQKLNNQTFKENTPGRTASTIHQPFFAVNLVDANHSSVELHLIQENNYGVKVPDDIAEHLDFKVKNGILNISFKGGFSMPDSKNRMMITAYAPRFEKIIALNTSNLNLITQSDSLSIRLKDCKYFSISEGLGFTSTKVTVVNGDTVKNETYNNKPKFKNLNIDLDHSNLNLSIVNLYQLSIKAQNNSEVEINGVEPPNKQSNIEHFKLITIGENDVKINHFNPKEMKVEVSDETKLEVETPLLKKFFKN